MSKDIYLSVVIPAYNEVANLKRGVLDNIASYFDKQPYSYEVVLANDGSSDNTIDYLNALAKKHKNFRVLDEPHRGKAGIVIAGMLAAKGEIVLFTDTDQATPIDQVAKLLPKFEEGYDIAIGSRHGRKGAPPIRKLMAFGFVILRTLILRLPYKDTQCGFKAFTQESSDALFSKMRALHGQEALKGYTVTAGFDLELLYLARKMGYKVSEVPVKWEDSGKGQVNPIKDSWIGFKGLIQVRLNSLAGQYKI